MILYIGLKITGKRAYSPMNLNYYGLNCISNGSFPIPQLKHIKTHPTFKIRSLVIEDNDVGNSSIWLLKKFRISKFTRFARPGGTTENHKITN